ncbi:helix-turn-helix domain-containing protein [Paenibacillus sp. FSL E2-0178]|uniref:helix-turn-helix domain-containing protein n=1 Tax=Paenibacillus sp. FSL E2-0178 TaxID=2921361 RepID=UPI00315954F1
MPIVYKLSDTLEELDITKNKLATEGKFRVATLHELEKGKSKSISFETLERILVTINKITLIEGKRKVVLNDVIDFYEDDTIPSVPLSTYLKTDNESSASPDIVVDDKDNSTNKNAPQA